MDNCEDPSEVDLFARGPAVGRIGNTTTHLGWPKGDPSSREFIDECLVVVKKELLEVFYARGGMIEIPLNKFGSEMNLVRFLMRVCLNDWFRENGLMIFYFGRKAKGDRFSIGLKGQESFWHTHKARGAYGAAKIDTYGVPEYGEELMRGIYGVD
ncbi:MAG: hypothetical protein HOO10_10775 [Candidatus Marinimicrobia bacterium]|jgi:hypothetical protein|nr:hypothetical protein [Candidatus Neomarinimicrobiota bacterium]